MLSRRVQVLAVRAQPRARWRDITKPLALVRVRLSTGINAEVAENGRYFGCVWIVHLFLIELHKAVI